MKVRLGWDNFPCKTQSNTRRIGGMDMKVLFTLFLLVNQWYYIPSDSPKIPEKIESINLKLKDNEIAVTFLSLSNGEAMLFQHSNGENLLINTGGTGTETELRKLLKLYNVTEISTVILTNADNGFVGNLKLLTEEFEVKKIITGNALSEVKNQYYGVDFHIWTEGTTQQILPNLYVEVLFDGENQDEGLDLSLKYMNHRIVIMASSSEAAESNLLKKELEDTNLVKISGFAIKDSMSESLIEHLNPQIAVIFHAKNKKPSTDLYERLLHAWIEVYYTKKHGTITIKFTDSNYEVINIST
jgi:competence protein ComEC